MKFFQNLFGDANQKFLDGLKPKIKEIDGLEEELQKLSDEELKNKSLELQKKAQKDTPLDDLMINGFALVREAAKRTLKQRHFEVQMVGGIVLHQGQIAEMKTGEGKTLTSTLPIYLNALDGKGVHVITVNDYLARRDAVWMAQVYDFLGLSIGIITHDTSFIYDKTHTSETDDEKRDQGVSVVMDYLRPVTRKEAYAADITYGTNNEFGFDYLRDNMAQNTDQQVQRGLNYAIVDEVDSVLIDEARTPLIISAPAEESTAKYQQFSQLVNGLIENDDYNIDEKMKACTLSEDGIIKMEKLLGVDNIYETHGLDTVHHLEQALKAKTLFQKDKDYVVQDNEVVIIDEFTGRMMQGRRYSEGLHQAIEAKEGVEVKRESMTLATVTFQNYFRMYKKLAGMTGTAETEAEEMAKIYSLDVTVLPTNRPFARDDMKDKVFPTERGKYKAMVQEIQKLHDKGQPVLVGTISIDKNELLGKFLDKAGIPHKLLNAKFHEKEAEIISQAGRRGAVTVATNMAGRGVDIVLGGAPLDKEKNEEVKSLGGLHVLGSERHESRRIDNQLRGRSGRQGDSGSSQFYLSFEDELMRIFASDKMKNMVVKLGLPEDQAIENGMVSKSIEGAQKKVEGNNFDIRKHLVEYDDVINKHRQVIYESRQNLLELFSDKKIDDSSSSKIVLEHIAKEIETVVSFHTLAQKNLGDFDPKEIIETINTIFPTSEEEKKEILELLEKNQKNNSHSERTEVIDYLVKLATTRYEALTKHINESVESNNEAWTPMELIEKGLILRSIDTLWVEHLTAMDKLRTGIGLQGYGQKDPLVEYKREAFGLFNALLDSIRKKIVYSIYKVRLSARPNPQAQETAKKFQEQKAGFNAFQKQVDNRDKAGEVIESKPRNEDGDKIGRNDPCHCGSGKKYKKCHGK